MKTTLLFPFLLLAATSVASAQTMSATNTGALSTNQLIYSVGEVFVVPVDANQASSGLIGAVTRIEFTSLSIDEIDTADRVRFYPNPTTGSLFLDVKEGNVSKVSVFDLSGKCIGTQSLNEQKIDLGFLPAGTYVIVTDNPNLSPFKVIKY